MKRTLASATVALVCMWFSACGSSSNSKTSSGTAASPTPSSSQPAPGSGSGSSSSGSGSGSSSSGSGSGSSGSSSGSSGSSSGSGSSSSGSGSGSSGSGSGSTGSGTPSSSTTALVYAGGTNNDFTGARVDSNGNVTATSGSPYSMPSRVYGLAINDHLLLAASQGSGSASESSFSADQDGNLTRLSSNPMPSDANISGIAMDASGNYAYFGGDSGIYGYAVNRTTGALSALPGSPYLVSSPHGWVDLAVAPNGSRLCAIYPALKSTESIVCFPRHSDGSIDTAQGDEGRPANPDALGAHGFRITSDSAYVIYNDYQAAPTVNIAPIGSTTSTPTSSAPTGGQRPDDVAVNGHWAAVVTENPNNIALFTWTSSGQIAPVGSPTSLPSQPQGATFSANGNYLFVSTSSGLFTYSFNSSTGALQLLNGGNATPSGGAGVVAAE